MLDGLLGRGGFSSKCKSLIKLTRTRIDVIRRKRGATQKFLKKDIADLLANGLEQNALGRVEGLFSELILSSCYDFIDHVCDIILKHLSAMQKQRECPEDCMEAVASLMFAAARFSDLPELRDLRDIFQERYGISLDHKVNQQLVEHISPKPPAKEQKVQLLRDIASEFEIGFNAMAFDTGVSAGEGHDQPKTQVPVPPPRDTAHMVQEDVQKKEKDGRMTEKEHHQVNKKLSNGRDLMSRIPKVPDTGHKRQNQDFGERGRRGGSVEPTGSVDTYPVKAEPVIREKRGDRAPRGVQERSKESITLSERRLDAILSKGEKSSPSYDLYNQENNVVLPPRKLPGEDTDVSKLKLKKSMSLPPPYVKPPGRTNSKHRPKQLEAEFQSNGENNNDTLSAEEFLRSQQNNNIPENNLSGFTEVYYKDDNNNTPRRRSRRRRMKSSASCSPDNKEGEKAEEESRVVRRVATSRRRNESSKKGLQILFDDDHCKPTDEEEKILDKMLLHYSKKDKSGGGGGGGGADDQPPPRRKDRNERRISNSSRSRERKVVCEVGGDDDEGVHSQHSSRSFSLPREQMSCTSERKTKVFTRAASFDHDTSNPAKHVHPKLPNYDDLAARFAALRRNQE